MYVAGFMRVRALDHHMKHDRRDGRIAGCFVQLSRAGSFS